MAKEIHVVMFPVFAFGHISPFVELSNKLSSHGIKISFSAGGNVSRIKSMLGSSSTAQVIPLNLPAVEGLPQEAVDAVMVDIENEPAKSIRNNLKKWKEFLQNDGIQNNFIADLVKQLRHLAKL